MITVNIKEADKEVFAKERYEHPHPRVNQRMDCLHLKAKGVNNKDICHILDICNNPLLYISLMPYIVFGGHLLHVFGV